jgi:uncharacterized protein (TIGR03085 family)
VSTHTNLYPTSNDDTFVAKVERAQLCDLLDEVGPHAPTLSGDWDTHHLAAHLVVREGTPLGVVTLMRPTVGDEEVERLVRERDFTALVDEIRNGPPRFSVFGTDLTDKAGNGLEFFIHHEDVRRAQPDLGNRELPEWAQDELWGGLAFMGRRLMRKAPVGVGLKRSDNGELRVVAKKTHTVVVVGLPSEIALFAYGRGAFAGVRLDGEPDDVAALRSARFSI